MPLGGSSILWNEAAPADTDSAGAGAGEIRSDKTAIRTAMGSEHFWASGGGANTGYHLLGSARAFYDLESNVSSSGTDGRLMVTSDTSRLFHVGSAGTMFLGAQRAISMGSAPVGGQTFHWVTEVGEVRSAVDGTAAVTIPNSGYSGVPFVTASVSTTFAATGAVSVQINAKTPTTFAAFTFDNTGTGLRAVFNWMSIGTRVL